MCILLLQGSTWCSSSTPWTSPLCALLRSSPSAMQQRSSGRLAVRSLAPLWTPSSATFPGNAEPCYFNQTALKQTVIVCHVCLSIQKYRVMTVSAYCVATLLTGQTCHASREVWVPWRFLWWQTHCVLSPRTTAYWKRTRGLPTGGDQSVEWHRLNCTPCVSAACLTLIIFPCICRGLFIIDDKGILRQITINDLPVGRSVDETLRLVQAFQFTDKHGEGSFNL